ncbi:MAG: hypothetical protein ACLTBV_18795 [Enterocloster bolteae]
MMQNYLLILAIATIGDFSKDVIESYQTKEIDYTEHKKNLQFASVFFDAYLEAKMYEGDQNTIFVGSSGLLFV